MIMMALNQDLIIVTFVYMIFQTLHLEYIQ